MRRSCFVFLKRVTYSKIEIASEQDSNTRYRTTRTRTMHPQSKVYHRFKCELKCIIIILYHTFFFESFNKSGSTNTIPWIFVDELFDTTTSLLPKYKHSLLFCAVFLKTLYNSNCNFVISPIKC